MKLPDNELASGRLGPAVRVESFWSTPAQIWIIRYVDRHGNQVGDAEYEPQRKPMLLTKARMQKLLVKS